MMGNRFSIAISWARKFFFPVMGNHAPAFTVASLATTMHLLHLTYSNFTTTPLDEQPPYYLYISPPAIAPISIVFALSSSISSMRSVAVMFPFSLWLSMLFWPAPHFALARLWRKPDN